MLHKWYWVAHVSGPANSLLSFKSVIAMYFNVVWRHTSNFVVCKTLLYIWDEASFYLNGTVNKQNYPYWTARKILVTVTLLPLLYTWALHCYGEYNFHPCVTKKGRLSAFIVLPKYTALHESNNCDPCFLFISFWGYVTCYGFLRALSYKNAFSMGITEKHVYKSID